MYYERDEPLEAGITVKIKKEDLKRFDKIAESLHLTRANFLRVLINSAIKINERKEE